ncbi:MAG: CehA/McbA family metallohydrolase [Thermodesulfobacteriota bacterium]|nr:CehA/McbA family metallohydrolase [Thermodesulfobacteriota bacterium]
MQNHRFFRPVLAGVLVCVCCLIAGAASAQTGGQWYKGDLHAHSLHSDGDSPVETVITEAESLGFDFFALTDHDGNMNGIPTHWDDQAYASDMVTLLYGVEWTTGQGHANVWAATPFDYTPLWTANQNNDAEAAIAEAHAQNALFSVNHPAAYLCCPWEYPFHDGIDSLEVWNAMYRIPNFNPWAAGQLWDSLLMAGRMLPCVGGSDTHQLEDWQSSLYGLGNPTTWVYAGDNSPRAILDGIKAGRTAISYAPDAPRLDFTADRDNDGRFETLIGGNLPGTGRTVTFNVGIADDDGAGSSGAAATELNPFTADALRRGVLPLDSILGDIAEKMAQHDRSDGIRIAVVIKNNKVIKAWAFAGEPPEMTFTDTTRDLDYYRVELYGKPCVDGPVEQLLYGRVLAMTGPIYVGFYDPDTAGGMNMYFGNLHSHTAYSDGEGTPEEAFAWARDVAGYDFYAVTDHAEKIGIRQWRDTGDQADAFNDNGTFVAMRGFEWSHLLAGHINVYNTDWYVSSITRPSLWSFYRWLDWNDGLAQFNHPGREPFVFHDFNHMPRVADNFFAVETGNKDIGNNDGEYLAYYPEALEAGWMLAPASNQDNHSLKTNTHRTVIVAPELSRAALLDAMQHRRLYSSDDPDIEVIFRQGDTWMGGTVNSPADGSPVTFTIAVKDDEPVTHFALKDTGGNVVAEKIPAVTTGTLQWCPEVPAQAGGYYVQVTSANTIDKDNGQAQQLAVTAPIWIR